MALQPDHSASRLGSREASVRGITKSADICTLARAAWRMRSGRLRRGLVEALLVEDIYGHLAVYIALRHRRIMGVDGPLAANDLRVTVGYVLNVSESDLFGNLLLQSESSLRRVGGAHNLRVNAQLRHTEQT